MVVSVAAISIYLAIYLSYFSPITKQLMQGIPIPQPSIEAVPKKACAFRMSRSSLGPRLSGSRFDTSRSLSRSQFVGSRIDATESTTAATACRSYQSSQSGNPDECQCGWPRRDHSVCKSCPTCDYKWLDRYASL